jgi:hypothetical protein
MRSQDGEREEWWVLARGRCSAAARGESDLGGCVRAFRGLGGGTGG